MAFIAARQLYPVELHDDIPDHEELLGILSNAHLSTHFQNLAREVIYEIFHMKPYSFF